MAFSDEKHNALIGDLNMAVARLTEELRNTRATAAAAAGEQKRRVGEEIRGLRAEVVKLTEENWGLQALADSAEARTAELEAVAKKGREAAQALQAQLAAAQADALAAREVEAGLRTRLAAAAVAAVTADAKISSSVAATALAQRETASLRVARDASLAAARAAAARTAAEAQAMVAAWSHPEGEVAVAPGALAARGRGGGGGGGGGGCTAVAAVAASDRVAGPAVATRPRRAQRPPDRCAVPGIPLDHFFV